MATMEEMQNSMTIIFNKRTGSIKAAFTGIQTMDTLYGDEAEDYKLIWDELVTAIDTYVINNYFQFRVNIGTNQLELLPDFLPKYPVAAQ